MDPRRASSLPEKGSASSSTGFVSYADIADIPLGKYDVYYEHFGDQAKFLGLIDIQ